LAVWPQQPPDATASAAVPQHGLAPTVSGSAAPAGELPQQLTMAGGVNASAGSPTNPPVVVVVSLLISISWK
jgi:hypothetical protein